jgi:Bacterial TSP3 repeat
MESTRPHRKLAIALAAALGLIALLALPGLAAAKARDRNHDGIPDRWEKRHHLSLRVNQAHRDQDHEGLDNQEEFENGTNPRAADTDEDGLNDAQEVEVGDDPNDADTDNDGIEDGEEQVEEAASEDAGEHGEETDSDEAEVEQAS